MVVVTPNLPIFTSVSRTFQKGTRKKIYYKELRGKRKGRPSAFISIVKRTMFCSQLLTLIGERPGGRAAAYRAAYTAEAPTQATAFSARVSTGCFLN